MSGSCVERALKTLATSDDLGRPLPSYCPIEGSPQGLCALMLKRPSHMDFPTAEKLWKSKRKVNVMDFLGGFGYGSSIFWIDLTLSERGEKDAERAPVLIRPKTLLQVLKTLCLLPWTSCGIGLCL